MAQATMQGVTLYSRSRRRPQDVFELAISYEGIEIRRPGETTRHLSWDRVSEWEIEQRRGGVLLTLRGGGSVTPLVIPEWNVDDLDVVLRDVTSNVPAPSKTDRPAARKPAPSAPAAARPSVPPAAKAPSAPATTRPPARRPETPRPPVAPVTPAVPAASAPAPSARPARPDARPAAAARPKPTFEDVVSEQLAPPKAGGPTLDRSKGHPDGTALVWPGETAPLQEIEEIPPLAWPEGVHEPTDPQPDASEFSLPGGGPSKKKDTAAPITASLPLVQDSPPVKEKEPEPEPETPFVATLPLVEEPPPVEIPSDMTLPLGLAPEKTPVIEQRVVEAEPKPAPVVAPTPPPAPVAPPPVVRPEPVVPAEPPIVIAPREGALDEAPSRVERRQRERQQRVREPRVREQRQPKVREPREAKVREPRQPRAAKVREPKVRPGDKRSLAKLVTTVVLLTALALAVALVLAQSAGVVNLPFLGSPT
jgi:hypothetical protein